MGLAEDSTHGMDAPQSQDTDGTFHVAEPQGPEEIAATYRDMALDCLQIGRYEGGSRLISVKLADTHFRSMALSGALRMRGTTLPGHFTVHVDLASVPGRRVDGELLKCDDLVVGPGRVSFELVTGIQHRAVSLAIPAQLFLDAFEQREPGIVPLPAAARSHVIAGSAPHVATVRRLAYAVMALADQPFDARMSTFVESAVVDAVIGVLLTPAHRGPSRGFRTPHHQRWPITNRAEEFMRANLGNPVMLHDICRAARASERSVSYAFHDIYGIGPMQFLRLLRLNQVRRELQETPPDAATVEDIAHSYGLFHAGHFFTNYRHLFGETPRQKRAPRDSCIGAQSSTVHPCT